MLSLGLLLYFLAISTNNNKTDTKYSEEHNIISPFVAPNGTMKNFRTEGHFLVRNSSSGSSYLQIGYNSKQSFGMIRSKRPIKFKDFNVSFNFSIENISEGGAGAGFGFWIGEQFQNGNRFYGGTPSFKGISAIIDITGRNPFIKVYSEKSKLQRKVQIKKGFINLSLRFERLNGKIVVSFNDSENTHVLFSGKYNMPRENIISVTSFSGMSESALRLYSIDTIRLVKKHNKVYVKGNNRKYSSLVIILGGASIIGLAYYLYSKGKKDIRFKN